jgi:hypothetical protein
MNPDGWGDRPMDERAEKRLHDQIDLLGLRAQATSVGYLTLTRELVRAGVLTEEALDRIKEAIVKELCLSRPPAASAEEFARTVRLRLDSLFAGEDAVGRTPPPEMAGRKPDA